MEKPETFKFLNVDIKSTHVKYIITEPVLIKQTRVNLPITVQRISLDQFFVLIGI